MPPLSARDQLMIGLGIAVAANDARRLAEKIAKARDAGIDSIELQAAIEFADHLNQQARQQMLDEVKPAESANAAPGGSPLAALSAGLSKAGINNLPPAKLGAAMSMMMDLLSKAEEPRRVSSAQAAIEACTPRPGKTLNPPE